MIPPSKNQHDPRKRLHPVLKRPFRKGDIRSDGFIFNTYAKTKLRPDGFYKESWLSPDAFYRAKECSKKAVKTCYQRQITKRRKMIDEIKLAQGCCICGYKLHAVALDFDHLDPSEKDFTIGTKYTHKPWQSILDEIEKCRILCANCHRVETLKQRNLEKN